MKIIIKELVNGDNDNDRLVYLMTNDEIPIKAEMVNQKDLKKTIKRFNEFYQEPIEEIKHLI